MRKVGTVDRLGSWIAGAALVAIGLAIIVAGVRRIERREIVSDVTVPPLPPIVRYAPAIRGIVVLLFGIPLTIFGARLIIRPAKLSDQIGRGDAARWSDRIGRGEL